jgi:hypothetical protein
MIGFRLIATSNTNFTRDYDGYNEGDFWISDAITVMSKMPGLGLAGKVIAQGGKSKDAINAAFAGLAGGALIELGDVDKQIGVTVHGAGDTFFAHAILNNNGDSGVSTVQRFVMNLKRATDAYDQEIGDQVMLQICKTIKMFSYYLRSDMFGQLWIEIEF